MKMQSIKRVVLSAGLMGSLLCGLAGHAQASVVYTNTVNFTTNNTFTGNGTFNWQHAVTPDFQIPFDTVNSASLTIHSQRAVGGNDEVWVVNLSQLLNDLGALGANGNSNFTTTLAIPNGVFTAGWASGMPLNLSLIYNQASGNNNTLTMLSSTLMLDYNNQAEIPSTSVPEPGPVSLMVLAMAGLMVARRRKQ
jgi:hypothetical protein